MIENGQKKLLGNSVNMTIPDVPTELLHEFSEKVMKPFYKGGVSEALRDLMQKAVNEQKQNETFNRFPWKKDEERFNEVADLVGLKRRYENYAIFTLGDKLTNSHIDVVFRSPREYPDAILYNSDSEETLDVEFEEFSSDFKGHDPTKCDLISVGFMIGTKNIQTKSVL
jgi:hypothetical protein